MVPVIEYLASAGLGLELPVSSEGASLRPWLPCLPALCLPQHLLGAAQERPPTPRSASQLLPQPSCALICPLLLPLQPLAWALNFGACFGGEQPMPASAYAHCSARGRQKHSGSEVCL